jgi:hypothetical protein
MRASFLLASIASIVSLSVCAAASPPRAKAKPAPAAASAPILPPSTQFDPQAEALRDKLGQSVLATPGLVLPDNHAQLDEALAERDWTYLFGVVRNPGGADNMMRLLNWERYQIYRGGSYGVAYMYVSTLAMAANSYDKAAAKDPSLAPRARDLRAEALAQMLYAFAIVAVDGARCDDPKDPQSHRDQIAQFTDKLRASANQLSSQERLDVLMTAVRQEKQLAPVRDPDRDLCVGGVDNLGQALEAPPEQATTTGQQSDYPAMNAFIPIDPHRPPGYRDRAEWAAREQAARDKLPDTLGALIDVSGK